MLISLFDYMCCIYCLCFIHVCHQCRYHASLSLHLYYPYQIQCLRNKVSNINYAPSPIKWNEEREMHDETHNAVDRHLILAVFVCSFNIENKYIIHVATRLWLLFRLSIAPVHPTFRPFNAPNLKVSHINTRYGLYGIYSHDHPLVKIIRPYVVSGPYVHPYSTPSLSSRSNNVPIRPESHPFEEPFLTTRPTVHCHW